MKVTVTRNPGNVWLTLIKGPLVLGIAVAAVDASDASGWDGDTYVLSVRDMEIAHDVNTDDWWSPAADLVVRIARTDPEVSGSIRKLEEANDRREARRQKAVSRYTFLDINLGRKPTDRVEPITDAQIRSRLRRYKREARTLSAEMAATKKQVANLRRLLSGSSVTIEMSSRVVDFGDGAVIRVYPDDEIEVSVWDDDFSNDDLYGRATVILDHATLEAGSLDVSMPNIKFVGLKFRRDQSVTVPE